MKRTILNIAFYFLLISSLHADVLYLNEGEEQVGKLERVKDGQVYFSDINASESVFQTDQVAGILISKIRTGDEFTHTASLTDPLVSSILQNLPDSRLHPNADYITLSKKRDYEFLPDGSVAYTRRELIQILKEPGLDMANRSLYYLSDRETCELVFAHTYSPTGEIHHITDDAVSDESLLSATPEYARLKKLKFAMKKVDIGCIIDLQYKIVTQPPTSLRPYLIDVVFGEREPVMHEELSVKFPDNLKILSRQLQWSGENLPVKSESLDKKTGTKTIVWSYANPKGYIPEQNMPSRIRIFPRVMVAPEDSWKNIAGEFVTVLENARPDKTLLESFIAEVKPDLCSTDLEKATRLHDEIVRKVRLIDVTCSDMGGIDPVSVDVTLQKRYGSNLARVTLLYFALQSLGIESRIGFVNSWRYGGVIGDIPNMGQVESAILKIFTDGEVNYTTCESDYLPFGHLTTNYQGATACFLNKDEFIVESLPEGASEKNRFDQVVYVKVNENGDFDVQDIRTYRGPFEAGLRTLRAVKDKQKEMYAERSIKRIHSKATLKGYSLSNLDDMMCPPTYILNYRIPDAAIKASDNIIAFRNLWVNYDSSSASLASRSFPMEYWATEENTRSIIFEIPEDFKWIEWDSDYSYNCGCLSYMSGFVQNGRILNFSDRFTAKRKYFDHRSEYHHYRQCILKMNELANQWIVIEKSETKEPVAEVTGPGAASETQSPEESLNATDSLLEE